MFCFLFVFLCGPAQLDTISSTCGPSEINTWHFLVSSSALRNQDSHFRLAASSNPLVVGQSVVFQFFGESLHPLLKAVLAPVARASCSSPWRRILTGFSPLPWFLPTENEILAPEVSTMSVPWVSIPVLFSKTVAMVSFSCSYPLTTLVDVVLDQHGSSSIMVGPPTLSWFCP